MSVALLLIFLGLMALGVPIAISLGAASVIVLITMGNMPLTMVVQLMYTSMNSFVMVAVPLFILAGSLMDEGGIADKIYDLAEACVGWIYGGLGHVAILCNIIFGAMYDENAEDEVTITVIATGLDAHGANTPVERAMKDFTNYKTKVPAQQAPVQRTAPSVKTPSEAAATTETSVPKYNIPTGNAPVYRPAQRGETQINIPDFLKNRR